MTKIFTGNIRGEIWYYVDDIDLLPPDISGVQTVELSDYEIKTVVRLIPQLEEDGKKIEFHVGEHSHSTAAKA